MTTKKGARAKVEKNWLEWVVFGAGLALVASTLAYLVHDGVTAPDTPPDVRVELGAPVAGGAGFVVPVTVTNRGGRTAEGVSVEVVLEGAVGEPERGEFTVAFLPRGGSREGYVAFRSDPRAGRLTARALGYEQP